MKHHIVFILEEETTKVNSDARNNILETALEEGLEPNYSCQGGTCAKCVAKVEEGEVTLLKESILSEEEIEDGFVLTCQAIPASDKIIINYDEA